MYLDWINLGLLVLAGVILAFGIYIADEGEAIFIVLFFVVLSLGGAFVRTYYHTVGLHNRQAAKDLSSKGYQFKSVDTKNHEVNAIGVKCVIPVKLNKIDGRWVVSMERTDGQFKELSAQSINLMGYICS